MDVLRRENGAKKNTSTSIMETSSPVVTTTRCNTCELKQEAPPHGRLYRMSRDELINKLNASPVYSARAIQVRSELQAGIPFYGDGEEAENKSVSSRFKPKQDDEVSITSSVIDFDEVEFIPLPWEPKPRALKIFGFDEHGNRVEEKSLPKITYAFSDGKESKSDTKKLLDYENKFKKMGEETTTNEPSQPSKDTERTPSQPSKVTKNYRYLFGKPLPKGETLEDYLRNIKENQTSWKSEDDPIVASTVRMRRKISEGSYPNGSVMEKNLPKLLRYTWKGKINKLKEYLRDKSKYSKINRRDDKGRTALHYAASWGCKRAMEVLLTVPGIKLDVKDQHGMTPLFKAVEIHSMECVKHLVEAGANTTITCRDRRTVLDYAVQKYGDEVVEIIEYLMQKQQPNDETSERMSLLHKVCLAPKNVPVERVVDLLIARGNNINAVEGNGRTPLMLAVMARRADIFHRLLSYFADVKIYDNQYNSVFAYVEEGSDCYKLLHDRFNIFNTDVVLPYHTNKTPSASPSTDNRTVTSTEKPSRKKRFKNLFKTSKYKKSKF